MTVSSEHQSILQQLLDLHAVDQEIGAIEDQLTQFEQALAGAEEGIAGLQSLIEQIDGEIQRARADSRAMEKAVDEKRDQLDRLRSKVNQVRNEKQYGAATLEFDLAKQDIRRLEDRALEMLQVVDDLENRQADLKSQLEVASSETEPLRQEADTRRQQLQDELAIKRDKRDNLAIRIDPGALSLYDRIHSGRSHIALAPLTDEGVCGNCYTSVTVQQEMQIKSMTRLICCEGCGVILYPQEMGT